MSIANKKRLFSNRVKKNLSVVISPFGRFINRIKYKSIAPLEKNITIYISDIYGWYRGNRYSQITYPGQIKGGDWSIKITLKKDRFINNDKYESIVNRYLYGENWKDTKLFRVRYKNDIKKGKKIHGLNNIDDIEKYYQNNYDSLFLNLKKNGVVPANNDNPEIAPIYVHINENGEILYTVDGNHRLYMCMILGIDSMPVRVWLRHEEWQKKRELLLTGKKSNHNSKEMEKYRTHPDIVSEL